MNKGLIQGELLAPTGGIVDVDWQKSHRSNSQGNCLEAEVVGVQTAAFLEATVLRPIVEAANVAPLAARHLGFVASQS